MVMRSLITLILSALLLGPGCTDATLIDTPRRIDTLDITRAVLRTVDVTDRVTANVLVNGVASTCSIVQGSRCTIMEYNDGSIEFTTDVAFENRSVQPALAVDVERCSLRCASVALDSPAVEVRSAYGPASTGSTIHLYRTETASIDYTDSTRVRTTVTRRTLSEQKTLDDLDITRQYDGFTVTDDTVRIPFDVFGLRSMELSIDTSFAIKIRHVGNRAEIARTVVEPPTYNGDPLSATVRANRQSSAATLWFQISADSSPSLQALLGRNGSVVIQLAVPLD